MLRITLCVDSNTESFQYECKSLQFNRNSVHRKITVGSVNNFEWNIKTILEEI